MSFTSELTYKGKEYTFLRDGNSLFIYEEGSDENLIALEYLEDKEAEILTDLLLRGASNKDHVVVQWYKVPAGEEDL